MMRFTRVSYEFVSTPRQPVAGGQVFQDETVTRKRETAWALPFTPRSRRDVGLIPLRHPQAEEVLQACCTSEKEGAWREAAKTAVANALAFALESGSVGGAACAALAVCTRRPNAAVWMGLQGSWPCALMGAGMGLMTGIYQAWHLFNAGENDRYFAALSRLRSLRTWESDSEVLWFLYKFLDERVDRVSPAARAAWQQLKEKIDALVS